jgi:hypothetical protein
MAGKLQYRIAIRPGGYSWACWSLRDEYVLIDLVDFNHLSSNESTGIVEASPSIMSKQVNAFLNEKGKDDTCWTLWRGWTVIFALVL